MTKLRDKRLFLLDMDGTIYIGDRLFDGVPEFLRHVRAMGGRYLFLTNNSSRGVEGYMEKLRRMGIETTRDDYLTSVDATVRYLRETLPGKTCYVFGTDSFLAQLDGAGIPVTRDREQAEVLLCGFDTELTFQKLEDACILLNRGVPFVATNPDWVCPTWYGSVPDCGSVCRSAITSCSYFGAIRTRLLSRILEACSKNASTYTFVVGGRCPHRPLQPNVRMPANLPTIYAKFAAFCCRGCVRFHCTTAIRKPHCRICLFSFGDLSDSRKKFCAFADNTRKTEKVLRNFQTITEKIKQALHRT